MTNSLYFRPNDAAPALMDSLSVPRLPSNMSIQSYSKKKRRITNAQNNETIAVMLIQFNTSHTSGVTRLLASDPNCVGWEWFSFILYLHSHGCQSTFSAYCVDTEKLMALIGCLIKAANDGLYLCCSSVIRFDRSPNHPSVLSFSKDALLLTTKTIYRRETIN